MIDDSELSHRVEVIEAGYEYLLAYAAQGRQDDGGTEARETLIKMHASLDGLGGLVGALVMRMSAASAAEAAGFIDAVRDDAHKARGAIGLVLSRAVISSLLVDNLNASIHLRALLTDVFLVEEALRGGRDLPDVKP